MKTLVFPPLIFVVLILFVACNQDRSETGVQSELPTKESPTNASLVGTMTTEQETSISEIATISVRGYIDVPLENRASVSAYYGGYVSRIFVLSGTKVKKGEVLFHLENPLFIEMQEQYLEAHEQLDYLKEDYERQKVLAEEEISSQKNFRKAESDYKVMSARSNGLKARLEMLGLPIDAIEKGQLFTTVALISPLDGSVTEVNIHRGVFVDPGFEAVEIVNTDHLHLELEVFEKDALSIHRGQLISFVVPEMRQQTAFDGVVALVVPAIDMDMRTFLVHGRIEGEHEFEFLPGMFVEATIYLE